METIRERLRTIVDGKAKGVTDADKQFLTTIATEYDVAIPKSSRCGNCWIDTAVQVYAKLQHKPTGRKYVLKAGVDVTWMGIRINAASCTDEKAKQWIADGFPTVYFERYED